jgi:hypothetical protein
MQRDPVCKTLRFVLEYWMMDRAQKPNTLSITKSSGQNNLHDSVMTQYPALPYIYIYMSVLPGCLNVTTGDPAIEFN